jgi:hypothetical protein
MRRSLRDPGRVCLWTFLALTAPGVARGQAADFDTRLMLSTVKLASPASAGTAFVLSRPAPGEGAAVQYLLVTAEHMLEHVRGDATTVIFHKRKADGGYAKVPLKVPVRRDGKLLWTRHPTADVAVLPVTPPDDARPPGVGVDLLASDADLARLDVHPGDALRCVGYPHPNQFESGAAGFAVVRAGCVASFPLFPTAKTRTFLGEFNVFEGDSGAAVYLAAERYRAGTAGAQASAGLILGLVSGQHFLDEEFRMVYQSGKFRHRMGMAIVVHASAVKETIERLDHDRRP